MILQGLASDSQAFLQHKRSFTQGQAVALYGCGIVGLEITQLVQHCSTEVMINMVKKTVNKIFPSNHKRFFFQISENLKFSFENLNNYLFIYLTLH
jgi:hypothetical protein